MISTIKNSDDQAKELTEAILNVQSFHLKRVINNKKLYFEEKIRIIVKNFGEL